MKLEKNHMKQWKIIVRIGQSFSHKDGFWMIGKFMAYLGFRAS